MSLRFHIFVTQRARDEAVDRIMAAFLDAYQVRPLDGLEPNGGHSLSPAALPPLARITEPFPQAGGGKATQGSESHGLILFERLLLLLVAVVTALIVAGNLWTRLG